jgi:subtilisin family serine protease
VSGVELVVADAFTTLDDPTAMELASAEPQSPTNPGTAAFYSRQWHLQVIKANAAWAAGNLGSSTTKVGILDTGLDYLHPDLHGRVDLNLSRSFLSQAENDRVQATWPGAHPVADLHYHGTHVGATVASNGLIAAGVTSQVTLVGLKVCVPGTAPAFQGLCPTSGTFQAILYAADNGIPVINMSLGGSFNRKTAGFIVPIARPELVLFEKVIEAVMTYANRRGTTVVVSAGNANTNMDAANPDIYFSYCDAPYVICVGATGPAAAALVPRFPGDTRGQYVLPPGGTFDARASYSNFGSNVDVVAPGGAGGAAVWEACSGFTIVTPFLVCRNRSYNPATGAFSGFVLGINGTSMAAPHTSGLAALVISNPGASLQNSTALIEQALERGADDIGAAGFDAVFGNGRINVEKTLAGLASGKITN